MTKLQISAEDLLLAVPIPTFEEMLDTTILNRIGQLCAAEKKRTGLNWKVYNALTRKDRGGYITLLTYSEIVNICRRNDMSVSMPTTLVLVFMTHVRRSLERKGVDILLSRANLTIDIRRDRSGKQHIVFIDRD